jgi:tetratricopeptide (TPR) repeat protein
VIAALALAALTATVSAHHPVTTQSAQAQGAFDRGLTLLYAYNGDGADQAFTNALALDPHLAMAAWGQAVARGTDLNTPLSEERFARAQNAAQHAVSLASYASAPERAYIAAVAQRYAGTYQDREGDEARYRTAMADLVAQYPLDDDAATLDAEGLIEHLGTAGMWNSDGSQPVPDAATALMLIQRVLSRNPGHLFANHLCMHAYDYAGDRTPAIACADRVASWEFDPQEEHLAHMPAHTYLEIGAYAKSLRASEYAWSLLEQPPAQHKYAAHDAYTGWSAAMMLGDLHVAEKWATRTGREYNGSDTWATWARFAQWGRIANSSAQGQFYAPLARGWTDLHFGVVADARKMLALYGNADTDYRWLLQAAIAEHDGKINEAVDALDRAMAYQQREDQAETLPLFPANEYLGALYYRQKQYAQARDAFQKALVRFPNDPRALYGLAMAERALGQTVSSADTLKTFNSIWNAPTLPDLGLM